MVKDRISERVKKEADYIMNTDKTVRSMANEFGISKSTIYKDLTERLLEVDPDRAFRVMDILQVHKSLRHMHGGLATKMKYERLRSGVKE